MRGDTWLDRQWGDWHWEEIERWTWMAGHLDNGEHLNVWDLVAARGEDAYATVLHRDGHHTIAPIVPLAEDAADFWHSPATGQTYPTRWKVQLPASAPTWTCAPSSPSRNWGPRLRPARRTVRGGLRGHRNLRRPAHHRTRLRRTVRRLEGTLTPWKVR